MSAPLAQRQIHLDFHTGPAIPDAGRDFNAEEFASTLAQAQVNSVTLFAKCHHGLLYFNTDRPERHPSLPHSLDMLGLQVEACRRHGIRTPIYLSVQCDEYAADLHPEWRAVNPDGTFVGRKPLEAPFYAWQILDMSSPYADYLAEQIEEVVRKFSPVDGIFLDMCWDQPSCSQWAIAGMRRSGLDPSLEADRNVYARQVVHGYMHRYNDLIEKVNGSLPRIWYNSRPKLRLAEEARLLKHVEIEALPTGGWGYTYFPLNVRFARNFGLPWIGMTGRFSKGWSDFGGLKPEAALRYECVQMLAHGGGCSIGDQLHPRGKLDSAAYKLIGKVYEYVKSCEPWCDGAVPVTEVGVFRDVQTLVGLQPGDAMEGVVRLLQQTFHQFDFVHVNMDLGSYRILVVPDGYPLDAETISLLEIHLDGGGRVVLCGAAALNAASSKIRNAIGLGALSPSDFKTVYLRYDASVITDADDTDAVLYDPAQKLSPAPGAVGVGEIIEPYFERSYAHLSGHCQTPPATASGAYATTFGPAGVAFGFDLFAQYATHGNVHVKNLSRAAFTHVLAAPLVRTDAPSHAEISVTRLPDGRHVVHVVSFVPQRRTPTFDIVEEATPLHQINLALRLPGVLDVRTIPDNTKLPLETDGEYAKVRISAFSGHAMIVFAI